MLAEDRRFFYLGMNQDSDPRFLKEGEYIEAKNFYVSSTDGGNDNALESIKDTLQIAYTLPSGRNKCVKIQDDEESQRTYIFFYNSSGAHTILYYKYSDKTLNELIRVQTTYSIWSATSNYSAGDAVTHITSGKNYICLVGYDYTIYTNPARPDINSLIWKEIPNPLNFQEDNFIDTAIIIRDGQTLLFWTDNHNEPKYVNVDKYINGEYPTVLEPEHLDLCPLQPLHEPIVDGDRTLKDSNTVFGKYFQFKYRWVFDDDMYGAWSPISEMDIYNNCAFGENPFTENGLILKVFRNSAIANRLKRIDVAFRDCRDGNSGDWYKFKEIDGSDLSLFQTYTTGTAGWGVSDGGVQYESYAIIQFENASERIPLDQVETNQLFSYVPKKAGTIAVSEDNRLIFGNIQESIDVSDVELDMTLSYNYNTASLSASGDSYLKGLKTGIKYKAGIRYSDAKGRLTPVLTNDDLLVDVDWYDGSASYPAQVTPQITIAHAPPEDAATWQLCLLPIGVDYEGSTPLAYQFRAGPDTKTVNGITYISLQTVRTMNTDYEDSVIPLSYSDEYFVRGVYDNSAAGDWGQYDESKVIETIDSGTITGVAILSGGSGYTVNPSIKAVGGGGGGETITASIGSGVMTTVNLTDGGDGFTSFPSLQVEGNGVGGRAAVTDMDFKKFIKIDTSNWSTQPAAGDILEVYKKNTDENGGLWREFGYSCKISRDSFGNKAHGGRDDIVNTGLWNTSPKAPTTNQVVGITDLNYSLDDQGDNYIGLIYVTYDATNFPPVQGAGRANYGDTYLELPFADLRFPSRSNSRKRPLVAFSPQNLPTLNTTLRWSDPLVQNSNINGLGFFYDVNFRELKNEYGTIQKIFAENEYLKIFFNRKMALLPMGRTELNSLNGDSFVAKTTNVFGTARYAIQDYGVSNNPESVSNFGGVTMFVDRNRNSVLLSSGMDIKVISDEGMRFPFDTMFFRSQELLNKPKIQSVYDKEFDCFILSLDIRSKSTALPTIVDPTTITVTLTAAQINELDENDSITLNTFNSIGGIFEEEVVTSDNWSVSVNTITATVVDSSIYNASVNVDVIQGEHNVIAYSPKINKWTSYFDYQDADWFGISAVKLVSSANGKFYIHNDNSVTTYGTFYGTKYDSSIELPFATEPTKAKNARTLEIESTDTNFYVSEATNENGQSTSLLNEDFDTREGRQWADILMDENTPAVGGITNPITEGDLMIGTYFKPIIKNTSTSLVKIFSVALRYVKSLI